MSLRQVPAITMARPIIGDEEISEVEAVLRSGLLASGSKVAAFENAFAAYVGTRHAVAVNSGTAALYLALLAHGIGPGDEVITSPFTFIATANSILLAGAKPVFADIRPDTFNLDPGEVVKKITARTRAVMPVHLYGQPCDMDDFGTIAAAFRLVIIEDACQAHGSRYAGRMTGSFGTGCFSFYPTKNITTGEGGIITTNDDDIAQRLRLIRNHGQTRRYYHDSIGYNFRMTDIGGALGICQLRRLPEFNAARTTNAGLLSAGLDGVAGLGLPVVVPRTEHVFHQYTVRVTERARVSRDALRDTLRERGITTEVYYPYPIHRQPLYRGLGYDDVLPKAERACEEVVSLPVHPALRRGDIDYIIERIREVMTV